jgi:hypothetical protein
MKSNPMELNTKANSVRYILNPCGTDIATLLAKSLMGNSNV